MIVLRSRGGKFVAGTVVVLAAAGGGAAIAATQLDSPGAHDSAIINDAAGQLGVQPSALSSALKKAYDDQIQAKVTSGEISQSQADALKKSVDAGNIPLFSGAGGGPAFGFGGGGPGPGHGRVAFGFGFGLDGDSGAAATYLGLTSDQIRTDLQSGKTLAQIAVAQGKTADGLVQAILAAQEANLDEARHGRQAHLRSGEEHREEPGVDDHEHRQRHAPDGRGALCRRRLAVPSRLRRGRTRSASRHRPVRCRPRTPLRPTSASQRPRSQADVQSGKTLAQLATAQGKTADGLVQAILAAQEANLAKLVTAGKLTSDQEQTIEKGLTTMITNIVNGTRPSLGGMGHFGFRRGVHGGASFRGSATAAPGFTE